MSAKVMKNWTIPAVYGTTPEEACDGWTMPFTRLMGDVISHRRIGNRWEPTKEGEAGIMEPVDVLTSAVVEVHGRLDDVNGVSVTTKSGTVYRLEGEPRPSFAKHCKALGVDRNSPNAVRELVDVLLAREEL